jgi:hypothetical protein
LEESTAMTKIQAYHESMSIETRKTMAKIKEHNPQQTSLAEMEVLASVGIGLLCKTAGWVIGNLLFGFGEGCGHAQIFGPTLTKGLIPAACSKIKAAYDKLVFKIKSNKNKKQETTKPETEKPETTKPEEQERERIQNEIIISKQSSNVRKYLSVLKTNNKLVSAPEILKDLLIDKNLSIPGIVTGCREFMEMPENADVEFPKKIQQQAIILGIQTALKMNLDLQDIENIVNKLVFERVFRQLP